MVSDLCDRIVPLRKQGGGVFELAAHQVLVQAHAGVFFEFAAYMRMAVTCLADILFERFVLVPLAADRGGELFDPGGLSAGRLRVVGEVQVDHHGDHQFVGRRRARSVPMRRHGLDALDLIVLQMEARRFRRIFQHGINIVFAVQKMAQILHLRFRHIDVTLRISVRRRARAHFHEMLVAGAQDIGVADVQRDLFPVQVVNAFSRNKEEYFPKRMRMIHVSRV